MNAQMVRMFWSKMEKRLIGSMAGELGFEPRLTESEFVLDNRWRDE